MTQRLRTHELVIPVAEETLRVGRRHVATGKVRVRTIVEQHQQVVDEPVLRERASISRIRINTPVDAPPPIRQEGDTTIIPILGEVLVVHKQLMLLEEVRIERRRDVAPSNGKPKRYTLRRERVEVSRHGANGEHPKANAAANDKAQPKRRSRKPAAVTKTKEY